MVIKDRSEPGVGDKTTLALVLVLEEWLDQKSAVSHVSSNSDHGSLQLLFLLWRHGHLGIQDRWSRVVAQRLSWILLQHLIGEDLLYGLVEVKVPDLGGFCLITEVILQDLVLLGRQLYFLSIEGGSELCSVNLALAQWVMVLKELSDSDSVSLDHVHDLGHQRFDLLGPRKINVNWLISGLGTCIRLIDGVLQD